MIALILRMTIFFVLLALLLRVFAWSGQGTLWFDETFSVHFSSLPWGKMFLSLAVDVHPPLYAIILKCWMWVFGDSDITVRMMSLIFGVMSVGVVVKFAVERFGRVAGITAGMLASFSSVLLLTSIEARMYPMLLFLVSVGAVYWFRFIERAEPQWEDVWPWIVCFGLASATHLSGGVLFLVVIAVTFYHVRLLPGIAFRFGVASAVALLPFLSWLFFAFFSRYGTLLSEWQFRDGAAQASHLRNVAAMVFGDSIFSSVLLFLCFGAVLWWLFSNAGDRMQKKIFLCVFGIIPLLAFSLFTSSVPKYFLVTFPFLATLVAGAVARLWDERKKIWNAVLFWAIVVVYSGAVISVVPRLLVGEQRVQWDVVARHLHTNAREDDVLVLGWFSNALPLSRYYDGLLPTYAITPAEVVGHGMSFDQMLVRYAGSPRFTDGEKMALLQALQQADAAFGLQRVFVLTGQGVNNPLLEWFRGNGWKVNREFVHGRLAPTLFILEKTQ